jgi:glutamyl-tRNA synthetase
MTSTTTRKIITRFAPSPTGVLHIGSVRTALYSWLYARKNDGVFILRIEDTDKERSKPEYEENIIEGMKWLGLHHDEFYRQSDRTAIYKKHLEKMIADGTAYVSKEEPLEEGQRGEVIRFKNPNRTVTFRDEVRGDISFDTTELKDFVIAKDFETPLYHFAVVVDDFEMNITHVIRGDDAISNTPRQILIQEALGAPRPSYTHLPMILAPDKSKLSKRHGALAVTEYRDEGYLPESLLNFVALMGWNPGGDQEIISIEEMINLFTLEKVHTAGAVFNIEKLKWLNKHYLKMLPLDKIKEEILVRFPDNLRLKAMTDSRVFEKIIPVILDRLNNFKEIENMVSYFFEDPVYLPEGLLWKDDKNPSTTASHLEKAAELLQDVPVDNFTAESTKTALWDYATASGRGNVLWPMRYALSGRDKSPDPFMLADILGKETTLRRIKQAQKLLYSSS